MRLSFTKMQGVGNDYIYVDARALSLADPARLAIKLSDRHFGIGSDGLVLLLPSQAADIRMAMYNNDGSEGAMCGNAVRCIAKYLLDAGIVAGNLVRIETKSGIKLVRRLRHNWFSVQMGEPKFEPSRLRDNFIPIDMGNPHLVLFPKFDISNYDIKRLGQRLSCSSLFPGGTNVEFVHVLNDHELQMRVWERGTGETLGCGTGACAAAVAAVLAGYCHREQLIKVQLPGGTLWVDYSTDQVKLLGPAVTVFRGAIEIEE